MQEDSPRPGGADYLDFDLEIEAGTGRDYPVAVLDSPAGSARGNMHFPFDELALENRLLTLQNALLRSGGEPRRTLSPEEQTVQDFGRALFEALFTREVRSCYDVSLREAARQGRGLRLKLRIQPPELAALPWEYLYHPGQCEYVSLSTQTPVVRYLEVPQRVQPLVVEPPLRILGMIASPSGLPPLDVEREKGRIEQAIRALRARGLMELAWLPGQSWRDLQRAMRQGPWHIFHFIGHGGFDRNTGEGLIVLADSEGGADRFHATQLGRLLADHASLRLVLLNSCEGARGNERDVFSSTAAILVRRGIPAVLAMQYEITDRAAVEFARTFYEALADGMAVDGAVAEARKAISFAVDNTVEWGTPVLYTRAPGGVLFQVTGVPSVERPTTKEARPSPQIEKRLERLYVDGLGAFWIEEWDEACRCFQAIVDEQPDYRDAAARLEQAEHQRRLVAFYTEAQAARAAKDWTGEFMALDKLVTEEPGFRDAADLREAAKRKRQLARLYAQAQELHAVGRWQAVVNVFARIAALDPEYPDPEGLLSTAEGGVAEQKRQGELDDLYSHALREMDAGQWAEARGLLAQLQEMEAGYRETERLLARAEAEIAEQKRQSQLNDIYSDALREMDAEQWGEARGLLAQIQEMEEGYRETEPLLAKVEAELAEQGRQAELDGLYSRALREMNAGRWAEARQLLIEIQEQEPGYRATERLLAEAGARLEQETAARQAREAQRTSEPAVVTRPTASRRRLPGWVMVAIGGLGLITFIVAVVLLSGGRGGREAMPEPTEAPAEEVAVEPTAAPEEPAPAPTEAPAEELAPEPEVTAVPAREGPEGTLTIALSNLPNSLDRPQAADRQAANASTQMWDSLVWVNEEGEVEPALAESYEISEDGTEYTFHLRDDVVFHNGEPFNADSVLLTWERAANADYEYSYVFTKAESVEKIDDYTVKITTPEPDALFLRLMADYWAMIPPQYYEEVGEEGFVEHPMGTGPFMFVEWVKGDHITMEANPNYWREGLPKVKTLIFRPIPESTTRAVAIQTGDVDVVGRLSSKQAQSLLGAPDVKVIRYPTTRIYYIAFNNLTTGVDGPMEDPRVRQAMNYAVDVEAIIDGLFDGFAEPATGFVAFGEMGYGVVEPIAYDPDKARELLAEAGYPDGFEMDFACPTMSFLDQVCEAVQGYLLDVGIETSLEFIELDQFWDLEAEKQLPPLFGDGWSSSLGEAYSRLYGALGGWDAPYSSWSDPVIDEFLANIEQAIDFEERKKLYEDLQVYMQEDPPFIYLYQPMTFEAINTRVQNYNPRPAEDYHLMNTWVVTEE